MPLQFAPYTDLPAAERDELSGYVDEFCASLCFPGAWSFQEQPPRWQEAMLHMAALKQKWDGQAKRTNLDLLERIANRPGIF